MRVFGVVGEEGAGAQHHRAILVVTHLRDDAVVQRRRVKEEARAGQQRHHRAGGQTESVKNGQRVKEFVVSGKIHGGTHLRHVGQNRPVRQHHALGFAFRARGKQHGGGIFLVALRIGRAARPPTGKTDPPQLVGGSQLRAQLFQIKDVHAGERFHLLGELGLLQKCARGDDGLGLHRINGGLHAGRARRVIEHRRNAAESGQANHQTQSGGQIGQQHADVLARFGDAGHDPTQHQRHAQQIAIVVFDLLNVLDDAVTATKMLRGIEQGIEQRIDRLRGVNHVLHQMTHGIASMMMSFFRRFIMRLGDAGWRQQGDGDFGEKLTRMYAGKA